MSMQQRPTRFYITQEEDHTVVRSVPMARRVRTLLPQEERAEPTQPEAIVQHEERPSVTHRLKSVVRRK
jgi:hypothetical protein